MRDGQLALLKVQHAEQIKSIEISGVCCEDLPIETGCLVEATLLVISQSLLKQLRLQLQLRLRHLKVTKIFRWLKKT